MTDIGTAHIDITANTLPIESIARVIAHHLTACADELAEIRQHRPTQDTEYAAHQYQHCGDHEHHEAHLHGPYDPDDMSDVPGPPWFCRGFHVTAKDWS